MIFINCSYLKQIKAIDLQEEFINVGALNCEIFRRTNISVDGCLIYCNGRKLSSTDSIQNGSSVYFALTLPGGKGGFGSMLRAIGAQIEKTTNREACRDLSGRRLRDINEEQRLKKWISKKAEREAEALKRRKERLERLKRSPKHEFHDADYNKLRSELPERIHDAVSEGFQKAAVLSHSKDDSSSENSDEDSDEPVAKKACLWLGLDLPGSSTEDSSKSSSYEMNMYDNKVITEEVKRCTDQIVNLVTDNCETETFTMIDKQKLAIERNFVNNDVLNVSENEYLSEESSNPPEVSLCDPSTSDKFSTMREQNVSSVETSNKFISSAQQTLKLSKNTADSQEQLNSSSNSTDVIDISKEKNLPLPENVENSVKEEVSDLDLLSFSDVKELETLGLEKLKKILQCKGLKCGGTVSERAERLWKVRGLDPKKYPKSLLAKKK